MRRIIPLALALATLVAGVVYWTDRPETTLQRIRRSGVVRVGYAPEPPFAYREPGGHVTGESPEVARAVFRRLGIARAEWVQTEFRALIPELQAGRFDVIAAGMFVTPERRRAIAFSTPTFRTRSALLVRARDTTRIRALADLRRDPDGQLAVVQGAAELQLALDVGFPMARIVAVPDLASGVEAVRAGRVDALVLSAFTLRRLGGAHPAGEVAVVFPLRDTLPSGSAAEGRGAFGFRRDDRALRDTFDAVLRRFVGTPQHLALVRPFGFAAADVPVPSPPAP